jgi:hypothetical protein
MVALDRAYGAARSRSCLVYATFSAYDEVAHHSGLKRPDTMEALRKLDAQYARIERVRSYAPRPYELVVLSDHGQTLGATFLRRNGYSLQEPVERNLAANADAEPGADAPALGLAMGDEGAQIVGHAIGEATARVAKHDQTEVPLTRRDRPRRAEQQRCQQQRSAVEDHRRPFGLHVRDRLDHQPPRERQERDCHQQRDIDLHHSRVGEPQAPQRAMVGQPDTADRQRSRDVPEVRRPCGEDAASQLPELTGRNPNVEYEQRDRDREHPDAERLGQLVSQRFPTTTTRPSARRTDY